MQALTREQAFPFGSLSLGDDSDVFGLEFAKAFLHCQVDSRPLDFVADPDAEQRFGPPFTVGLEFEAVQDFEMRLGDDRVVRGLSRAQQLLYSGRCSKGTNFRLRIASPTSLDVPLEPLNSSAIYHLVELQIDELYTIRNRDGTISCSPAFLSASGGSHSGGMVCIGQRRGEDFSPTPGIADPREARLVNQNAERLIRELARELFRGFFWISAIREPCRARKLQELLAYLSDPKYNRIDLARCPFRKSMHRNK
jgi:hypothetical protein